MKRWLFGVRMSLFDAMILLVGTRLWDDYGFWAAVIFSFLGACVSIFMLERK